MKPAATSAQRAAGALRELILRGEFATGTRLGEVELAERLGVSRTPVREALTRLAAEGLVELVPNRGARVSSWTVAELEAEGRRSGQSDAGLEDAFLAVTGSRDHEASNLLAALRS